MLFMTKGALSEEFQTFMNRKSWERYSGEWVAICDDEIVANNPSLKKVIKESAKKYPDKVPTFTKIPDKHVAMVL